MDLPVLTLILIFLLTYLLPAYSALPSLRRGSSLFVEHSSDFLVSPTGSFSAGFFPVGDNAFTFTIWHGGPVCSGDSCVPVWMANRDVPVNGKRSRLSLRDDGDLVLVDAGFLPPVWSSETSSSVAAKLQLKDTGNLVLTDESGNTTLWQSFDFPTDTILPTQIINMETRVVSSRSRSNYSRGFYGLHFNDQNVFSLVFSGPIFSRAYWPFPWERMFSFNSSGAVLDPLGYFSSSDDFHFYSSDYGRVIPRRLTLDPDGNLRLYSLNSSNKAWLVTWQASSTPCSVYGLCGSNSLCGYDRLLGRRCSCIPGHEKVDPVDWSLGCRPIVPLSNMCSKDVGFMKITHVDFYGYDMDQNEITNKTLVYCRTMCINACSCKGFMYVFEYEKGTFRCYFKVEFRNGHINPSFTAQFFIKVNKSATRAIEQEKQTQDSCTERQTVQLNRAPYTFVSLLLWFAVGVAGIEMFVVFVVWFFFFRNQQDISTPSHRYILAATRFQRFTYGELKKATKNFDQEIGRGAGGIVYLAVLPDNRVAAVKLLNEATTGGEADFLAEVNTIGRINHMNLIELWGYCAEGKHRLLVYEYMEHGSLAKNLSSPELDWRRRYDIAVGTAKGLAYLHEECLEWVLHCDVKPQNILLDSEYTPKVADFGLSKLMDRADSTDQEFSRIRGTRGYMAPEWVSNMSITSKVDVYSYGIVMLELVTGMNAAEGVRSIAGGEEKHMRLIPWVRQKMKETASDPSRSVVDEIVDPRLRGDYDVKKMEILIGVALRCVMEDKNSRPTMGEIVEMLLREEEASV
ncbi:hypothetical protein SAY86_015727 [Trapa natans]|uniref:Receptor-like serine/threonine-protein kinase n=1 Tax=Trapa natans TaxID=22666 RepID=A0AAN7QZ81_TRANT|nr:hypothetical protein SAY86_015727 [Trapa natans]